MSRLIALVFDDELKGEEESAALQRMAAEGLLEMNDTVFISRKPDGKTSVSQENNVMGRDQKIGHVAGLIAAAVTRSMPFVLVGILAGQLIGRLTDDGITRKFIRDLKQQLQPGTSGLVVLGSSDLERRQRSKSVCRASGGGLSNPTCFPCSGTFSFHGESSGSQMMAW